MNPYDFFAEFYHAHYDHGLKDILLDLIVSKVRPTTVFEVGAGPGMISFALAEEGYNVTASDISETFLAMIERQAKSRDLPVKTQIYDVLTPPQQTYGLSLMVFDVINHLETLDQFATAIKHLRALTEPGGYYLFDVIKTTYFASLMGYSETFQQGDQTLIWSVKQGTFKNSVRHQFQKGSQIQTLNQRTFDEATIKSLIHQEEHRQTVALEDRQIYLFQKK